MEENNDTYTCILSPFLILQAARYGPAGAPAILISSCYILNYLSLCIKAKQLVESLIIGSAQKLSCFGFFVCSKYIAAYINLLHIILRI
jgi:hypothetical protein